MSLANSRDEKVFLCVRWICESDGDDAFDRHLLFSAPTIHCVGGGGQMMSCVAFFANSIFYSILNAILRFNKDEAEVRKQLFHLCQHAISELLRLSPKLIVFFYRGRGGSKKTLNTYFDVISEVNCVLPRMR